MRWEDNIRELHSYTQKQFEEISELMRELSERIVLTHDNLTLLIDDNNCHLYVVMDGEIIIGCATLCIFYSPTGTKASIEDVVVSTAYRGQHLGKILMEHLLSEAKRFAPIDIHLTSKPKRIAANKLYQSLGFVRKETNCYTKLIE